MPKWGKPSGVAGVDPRLLNKPSSAETPVSDTPTRSEQLAASLVDEVFGFANLAASQSALQATRDHAGTQSQTSAKFPWPGSVVGLRYESNAAKTAGLATFVVYIAGAISPAVATWTVNNLSGFVTFAPGTYLFSADEAVDVRATTDSSFAPVTLDVRLTLYVSFSQ